MIRILSGMITPFVPAVVAGIRCVVVDAEGASVDLRRPRRDKFRQQRLQTIGLKRFPRSIQGSIAAGLTVKGFSLVSSSSPFGSLRRHDDLHSPYVTCGARFFCSGPVRGHLGLPHSPGERCGRSEIGTIQKLGEIGGIVRGHGPLLHFDAAQAPCAMDVSELAGQVDLLSLSAHKIYGPKGIGILYVKRSVQKFIEPIIHGGGQQCNLRSGACGIADDLTGPSRGD
jgi:hypothetical protein